MNRPDGPMNSGYTIWHNPACGTSRTVLGMLRASGVEPIIIEYLQSPPSRGVLQQLLRDMGMRPKQLLREKEAAWSATGLDAATLSDGEMLDQLAANPVLMNRPIVRSPTGTRLCRPAEVVRELLPRVTDP